ncbi:conserved Plasmodium protein, unknown function [Plasmodium chabaudi chabaudi]|uniref:Uncharacterized protein n=1 Tax=Plasmodium chabaudi chabaudi TaxID=31271 RepID=A0A1C6X9C3_PLACU|nr:conserved Plasmodium protein, unknown function [Plasmodium chabaudi chabaudi]
MECADINNKNVNECLKDNTIKTDGEYINSTSDLNDKGNGTKLNKENSSKDSDMCERETNDGIYSEQEDYDMKETTTEENEYKRQNRKRNLDFENTKDNKCDNESYEKYPETKLKTKKTCSNSMNSNNSRKPLDEENEKGICDTYGGDNFYEKDEENNDNKGKDIKEKTTTNTKKKYVRLLKNLENDISYKIIDGENKKRTNRWGDELTLQQKINLFIKNKIATKTEYKYGRKPNTLSICNQFNLHNHLTMLNDFNRLHYYRAAMRWTGYNRPNDPNGNIIENEKKNNDLVSCNSHSLNKKDIITPMNNTNNLNIKGEEYLHKYENNDSETKNPYIFFENNKDCYVYNKNIIEVGTGPLSLLSINAILNGAKHVDALEVNKDASEIAKKLIEGYNLEDYIRVINCYSKAYAYREESHNKRVKKKNFFQSLFKNNLDEHSCKNFNYDLIISEVIGDFASQEGVADIYLDLHKKIFSYRKYQEYLIEWEKRNGNNNNNDEHNDNGKKENNIDDAYSDNNSVSINNGFCKIEKRDNVEEEGNSTSIKMDLIKDEKKISYKDFADDDNLYKSEEFYNMNIKSIPYSVTTYYCPVKFPYYDNIVYKSIEHPERTIISPQNKLLQSILLEWFNLTLNDKDNDDSFGKLEYIHLEENLISQMIQRRSKIFEVDKNESFCGFLITIDVEIRKGEHFGTKYGTCDSWYTNIVLLNDEIHLKKKDLIISKTYTNLLNYNEHFIGKKTILVSRPSYTFYGYILRLIENADSDNSFLDSSDCNNSNYDKKSKNKNNNKTSVNNNIYLDDETILLLDNIDFHKNKFSLNVENKIDKTKNGVVKENSNSFGDEHNKFSDKNKGISLKNEEIQNRANCSNGNNRDKGFCNILDNSCTERDKLSKPNESCTSVQDENETDQNNKNKDGGNAMRKNSKSYIKRKKKKDAKKDENKHKKDFEKSREEYEKDISDITNNYDLNVNFYSKNLKDKVIVYKNAKYKLLTFYKPVIIDYDEQATVIYTKDDIYNGKENDVDKFVNNIYE